MPRRTIPFLPGQYHHIYNRGNNRQAIFFQSDNYLYFLRGIKRYLCPHVDVIAYCLMPNHYHLLVRVKPTPEPDQASPDVSRAMMRLSVSYTKAINKRFGRVGVLFQGSFRNKWVDDDAYLRHLCVYIHANPVKDGLVPGLEDWPYSNYHEWMELRPGKLVDRAFIAEQFGSAEAYHQRVLAYLRGRRLPENFRRAMEELEGF